MALEYTGSIVLEVNSTEVEVTEFSPARPPVKSWSRP